MVSFKGSNIPTCFATCSIGHDPSHNLPKKLEAISKAGFEAIELSMPDILSFGQEIKGADINPKDYTTLCEVGARIRDICKQNKLKILMLQPFANFEGWPKGSSEREDAFARARGWTEIMEAIGTDMLQIGSSDAIGISSPFEDMANDLAELADILAKKNFRIAYENWCWASHAADWKDVWKIVEIANRPNIGLCLDTFQSAGGEWADPTTTSGMVEDMTKEDVERKWRESCDQLSKMIPGDKIFLLQISDAYKMNPALPDKLDDTGTRPRGQWSHDFRPMPYDGGYLPVEDFTKAVLKTGFRGWLSMECFDGKARDKYEADLLPFARNAMKGITRLLKAAEN